jgi:hypothetical protein
LQGSEGFRKLPVVAHLGYNGDDSDLEVVPMAVRVRLISTLIAVLAMAVFVAPTGSGSSRAGGAPAWPTLYVNYTMNCTFSIVDDLGKPVTQIPPGTYQVEVVTPIMFKLVVPGGLGVDNIAPNDYTGCKGWVQFQLTGPGVNVSTTLDSGCDAFLTIPSTYFKPGATYTAQDLNQPSVAHATFTTAASGTPLVPKSPYGTTSGKGSTQGELAGSENVVFRGTLAAALSAQGKPTLTTSKGKPVSILKSGSYKFVITDHDAKGSFNIQKIKADGSMFRPDALTGVTFIGKHTPTITLKAGHWTYFSGHGTVYHFLVVS